VLSPLIGHPQPDDVRRHFEVPDSSGTPILLLHGGLFDIHQQFGELLPRKLDHPPTTGEVARNSPIHRS
jgi:hypothetical protein